MDLYKLEHILESEGIIFVSYGGLLSQQIIVGMTEALEHESESNVLGMKTSHNILSIFIELSQNMLSYGHKMALLNSHFNQKGLIIVGYEQASTSYYILSRNIIKTTDMEAIKLKIEQLLPMNKDELKTLYRELRKSGKDKHEKGAGIGFIEIARRCDHIEYTFTKKDEDTHYFAFKAIIQTAMV